MAKYQAQDARRVILSATYNGKTITDDLADDLLDFTYTDAPSGDLDDIQITIADRADKWIGPWSPSAGDRIKAEIIIYNWNGPGGRTKRLPCGTFEVDSFGFTENTVSIRAISLPISSSAKFEKHNRTWEKVTLKTLATETASRAGLKLMYESVDNPSYDRLDQTDMSDLAFLLDQCKQEGIAIKVSSGKLVLFDETVYERRDPITTVKRGTSDVLSVNFSWSTSDVMYRSCEITYRSPKGRKHYHAVYTPPGAPKSGPVLRLNEQVGSDAEAYRRAAKRLREKNKDQGKASMSLVGDVRLAAGCTIKVIGWSRFDGKYLIESASHKVGSGGYTTDLEIRKVLGW